MSGSPPSRAHAKAIRVPSGANDGVIASPGKVVSGVTLETRPSGVECAPSSAGCIKCQAVPTPHAASVAIIATAALFRSRLPATCGAGRLDGEAPPSSALAGAARLVAAPDPVTEAVAALLSVSTNTATGTTN